MNKKLLVLMVVAVMALSTAVVLADTGTIGKVTTPDGQIIPVFKDGRLNAFDIGAPVVVFYTFPDGSATGSGPTASNLSGVTVNSNTTAANTPEPITTVDMAMNQAIALGSPVGIELLAVDPLSANGGLALDANFNEVMDLISGNQDSISQNGYSLNYNHQSNWFWVVAPADSEGKVYTFSWENKAFPVLAQAAQPSPRAVSASASTQNNAQATEEPTAMPTTTSP